MQRVHALLLPESIQQFLRVFHACKSDQKNQTSNLECLGKMQVTALTAGFKLNKHIGLVDGKRRVEAIVTDVEYLKGDGRRV